MLAKAKYIAAEFLKQHPRTWSLVWNALPRITFLLPHDKSYYGFQYLADAGDGLFLDVGANNGMTAAGFRKLNKNYRILSLEANAYHRPALVRLKRRLPRFEFTIVGVGRVPAELRLYTPIYNGIPIHTHTSSSRSYLETSLRRDFSPSVLQRLRYEEQVVQVVTVDSLELQPRIVKIDVEGHDYDVLLGMTRTIAQCRPSIMLEFTPTKVGAFTQFFADHSYGVYIFDDRKHVFLPFDEARETSTWQHSGLQVNVFAVPAERSIPLGTPSAQDDGPRA